MSKTRNMTLGSIVIWGATEFQNTPFTLHIFDIQSHEKLNLIIWWMNHGVKWKKKMNGITTHIYIEDTKAALIHKHKGEENLCRKKNGKITQLMYSMQW